MIISRKKKKKNQEIIINEYSEIEDERHTIEDTVIKTKGSSTRYKSSIVSNFRCLWAIYGINTAGKLTMRELKIKSIIDPKSKIDNQ